MSGISQIITPFTKNRNVGTRIWMMRGGGASPYDLPEKDLLAHYVRSFESLPIRDEEYVTVSCYCR
jgi:hypothetical protein